MENPEADGDPAAAAAAKVTVLKATIGFSSVVDHCDELCRAALSIGPRGLLCQDDRTARCPQALFTERQSVTTWGARRSQ
jgi:hypothetical protein